MSTKTLPTSLTVQFANADIRMVQIEAVAKHLAILMEEVHGGSWRVQIDHENEFLMVAKRPDRNKGASV